MKNFRCQLVKKGIVTVVLLIFFGAVNFFNTSIFSAIDGSQLRWIALGVPSVFFVLLLFKQLSKSVWRSQDDDGRRSPGEEEQ